MVWERYAVTYRQYLSPVFSAEGIWNIYISHQDKISKCKSIFPLWEVLDEKELKWQFVQNKLHLDWISSLELWNDLKCEIEVLWRSLPPSCHLQWDSLMMMTMVTTYVYITFSIDVSMTLCRRFLCTQFLTLIYRLKYKTILHVQRAYCIYFSRTHKFLL